LNRINTLSRPRSEPESRTSILTHVWTILSGLLIPVLVVLVGLIAVVLDSKNSGVTSSQVRLGTHLSIPVGETFSRQPPLIQLAELVFLSLAVSSLFCLAVWLHRRAADSRARNIVKSLHTRVLKQSVRRAELEGAAAQRVRAEKLIGEDFPRLQNGLSLWYRSMPRSAMMLAGCLCVALLVNVWLALLAVVSCVLMWQFYRWLHDKDEEDLMQWEVPRTRRRMSELVGQAPLLARLQSQGLADRSFSVELDTLYRRLQSEDQLSGRIWPLLFLASSVAIAVMVFGLGVNLFGVDKGLSVPAALVLGLALTGAVISAGRLLSLATQLRPAGEASDSVYYYLRRSEDLAPSEQRVGLARLRESVEIRDVTIGDSAESPLLSHLSLKLKPGTMVALLGTETVSTRTLAELLMGFGHPKDGYVLIDGIRLLDVHPQALARNVMWIEPTGPIWDGTVLENLQGGDSSISTSEIVASLERVGAYERLQRLPEGLNTILTADDSSLGQETTYAMAIARALLHKPPILLVLEPPLATEHIAEDPCLTALQQLVKSGTLVIMLPRRLQTLRIADRVVLLNGPRLAGEGKHAELLSGSDLYRHLNYLLFNPYRHQDANV
jgi:ATP-binding cassette, subfamily B, bacterial